jgi:serine-type D-Ala-D-Ala carboxypeptidase/endopeptidase (penicillin-binding protein 4)
MTRRLAAATAAGVCAVAAAAAILLPPPQDSHPANRSNPTPTAPTRPAASAVLESPRRDSVPNPTAVQALLDRPLADPALRGRVGASVIDLDTGTTVFDQQGSTGFTPASTAKLLTAIAVLDLLGPDHRFETRVTWRPSTGEVILVGGGDPLLSRGSDGDSTPIEPLASQAAAALRRQGIASAAVRFDDSLFAPELPPSWPGNYVPAGIVHPTSPLSLDGEPAAAAAAEFGRLLQAQGIQQAGPVARTTAVATDQIAATADSAPLGDIVEHVLVTSDNDAAEVLGRHAALAAGLPATPDGVVEAVRRQLTQLGLEVTGAQILDASGLSPAAKVPPAVLTAALRTAAAPREPELRPALTGLPIGAFTGTLTDRFDDPEERQGAGHVRAKTGTLTGVASLAGLTTAADGHTYAFAFLADAIGNANAARDALDRAAAALTGCGCAT